MTAHVFPHVAAVAANNAGAAASGAGVAVTVEHLRRSFDAKQVLRDVSFQVPAGQFVAIVGRSGCGKSTLLRLIAGLDRPTGGRVWFGDAAAASPSRAVRMMFQEPRLLPWSRVLSNVEVGLSDLRGSAEGRASALAALGEVGLQDRRDDWPAVLSGGQKQRVALARALVSRPRVLAFDEPLGALDALTRISMQRLLARVWRDQGFTAILVTHDVAEAVTLADRVLMIEDGEIALDLAVDLPRPRERGAAEVAALEGAILRQLFRNARPGDDA